ncbi:phosphopentomutase [Legionella sp. W05-934-2]|uniref:phosphopentomutase n=1 Tax=Legionella sp. W05-934-2 TaxID=1198649 RepID=UPI0034621743
MHGRVCVLLMDSFGIGASLDAHRYGDSGANTLGHIIRACESGLADNDERQGLLNIPNLAKLGIYHALVASSGEAYGDLASIGKPQGLYGYAVEQSAGKDTPSGHWEIAGVPVLFDWGYFPNKDNCFPKELIEQFCKQASLPGVLGECHASGTTILETLGEEHIKTGKPIVYTSADSVFQIAAHEHYFGLQKLYDVCEIARKLCDSLNIGRVIARPFIGEPGNFSRTANRKDYSVPPPSPTLLDKLINEKREVIAIGKTADIFAHQGISQTLKADNNMHLFDETLAAMKKAKDGSLIFTNFVDFDSKYGHRRNVSGYAHALEQFDNRLPTLINQLQPQDKIIITADHGCDPTMPGSDHTREHIPVLAYGPNLAAKFIGRRDTFADIGQSIASWLGIKPLSNGVSFA